MESGYPPCFSVISCYFKIIIILLVICCKLECPVLLTFFFRSEIIL